MDFDPIKGVQPMKFVSGLFSYDKTIGDASIYECTSLIPIILTGLPGIGCGHAVVRYVLIGEASFEMTAATMWSAIM